VTGGALKKCREIRGADVELVKAACFGFCVNLGALVDNGYRGGVRRVAAADSFIPLGPAANHLLVSERAIENTARALLAR